MPTIYQLCAYFFVYLFIKVWSDYKNNVKSKWAKINRAAQATGGGPALQLSLTDLENRIMQIIGVQAATGMAVNEAGFGFNTSDTQVEREKSSLFSEEKNETEKEKNVISSDLKICSSTDNEQLQYTPIDVTNEDWNVPGTSQQPTAAPSPKLWKPPPKKKPKMDKTALLVKMLRENEAKARESENERVSLVLELERERIRQRDVELPLQGQLLEVMKEILKVLNKFVDDRNK
ncbi:uncharacterized protein LOC106719853 [Papilio machaon]|uniref:uncharacterized protein LOC106719853 n=1 Tax=Papilio machaon TaxID=76193 RepID=UPI001E664AD1|nr:uncharacterized protein LOC106719853 [Papilio machaon]